MASQTDEARKQRERGLFLSVWVLIVLIGGIVYFATHTRESKKYAPQISLSPEMGRMFLSGLVSDYSPLVYHVALHVRTEYLASLQDEDRSFQIGYRYEVAGNVVDSGVTKCVIEKGKPMAHLKLSNPNHVSAHKIELLLAH